jgi:hypothetical protein
MNDRDFVLPRWRSGNTTVLAAREGQKLIGVNVATRWGSFGFFGPLTILPDYWNRGVAQQLLAATMKVFNRWGVRHSGLFTFASSPKHVCLYQKFGYWPGSLTAIMKRTPAAPTWTGEKRVKVPVLLSAQAKAEREQGIAACARLTNRIDRGLDLGGEIRAVIEQRTGEVVLSYGRRALDAFAVCMLGAGSEGSEKICYVKFGAANIGPGCGERFDRLLDAIDALALTHGAEIEAGVSLACEDAFQRMRMRGYQPTILGVSMQRPHGEGFNRAGTYVMGDWR